MGKIYDNTGVCFGPGFGKRVGKIFSLKPEDGTGDFAPIRLSSATYLDVDGLIKTAVDNDPRRDYTTTPDCGDLLLEPQSTNIALQSESLDSSPWALLDASITANVEVSPDGQTTADKIVLDNGIDGTLSDSVGVRQTVSVNTGVPICVSFYLKAGEYSKVAFRDNSQSGVKLAVDLSDGSIINGGVPTNLFIKEFYPIGDDGWYRVAFVRPNSTGPTLTTSFCPYEASADGVSGFYCWGVQYEYLDYPTSYIKTESSIVSRSSDRVISGGSVDSINSEEGVLFVEISALADTMLNRVIGISDGTTANEVFIRFENASNRIDALYRNNGNVEALISFNGDITLFHKVAFKWKQNDFALWVDGVEIGVDTSGNVLPANTFDVINFSNSITSGGFFEGRLRQIQVIKTALTDEELQNLTAI